MIRKASPEAFDNFIGRDRVEQLAELLYSALSEEERHLLSAPPPPTPSLGARLERRSGED